MAFMPFPEGRSSAKSSSVTQTRAGLENENLQMELKKEQLKRAIREARGESSGSSGSGSSSSGYSGSLGSGKTQDQRDAENRAYDDAQNEKSFQRQRQLNTDRADAEARAAADNTANIIRQRQEASSRGLRVAKALSRARR